MTADEKLAWFRGYEGRRADLPERAVTEEDVSVRDAWLRGWREADETAQLSEAIRHARRQHRLLTDLVYETLGKLDGQTLWHCMTKRCPSYATREFRSDASPVGLFHCTLHVPTDAYDGDPRPLSYGATLRELLEVVAAGGVRYIEPDRGHLSNGLYGKYVIQKADGAPVDPRARYFVLRYDTDPHAKVALRAYADEIRPRNPKLAGDIDADLAATTRGD